MGDVSINYKLLKYSCWVIPSWNRAGPKSCWYWMARFICHPLCQSFMEELCVTTYPLLGTLIWDGGGTFLFLDSSERYLSSMGSLFGCKIPVESSLLWTCRFFYPLAPPWYMGVCSILSVAIDQVYKHLMGQWFYGIIVNTLRYIDCICKFCEDINGKWQKHRRMIIRFVIKDMYINKLFDVCWNRIMLANSSFELLYEGNQFLNMRYDNEPLWDHSGL